jgi:hypothetical protein
VTAGIPNGISIYWDLLELPGARYYWAEGKWLPLAAEKWETVPARQVRPQRPQGPEVVRRQGFHRQGRGGHL